MNNTDVVQLQLGNFLLIYLLLLIVLGIMKRCKIKQSKLVIVSSVRMTLQLVIAGYLLTYIFKNPKPIYVSIYLILMITFSIFRVIHKNKDLNKKFKWIIAGSMSLSGIFVMIFFVVIVVKESIFNPQYIIPIGGMIMGNSMTGVLLGIKSFKESLDGQRTKIESLLNIGAHPKKILFPFVSQAIETAMLPTLNSMLGMGIVSLPGMMTGQILSGTVPTSAILYQIAIMIAVCTVVCLSCFGSLYLGYKTFWDSKNRIKL